MLRTTIIVTGVLASTLAAIAEQKDAAESSGTGFFINDAGWAITNAHVLEGCGRAMAVSVGETTDWIIDKHNDLAAVRVVGGEGRPFLSFRGARLRLGEDIAALGYPLSGVLSDSIKVTTGNINSLVGIDNDTRYLQISAPLQPGNSGGPVVDRTGSVVGIATAALGPSFAKDTGILPQNVNFALSANVAETFLQSRSVDYRVEDTPSTELSTADLAEMVAKSVVQIVCFKENATQDISVNQEGVTSGKTTHSDESPEYISKIFAYAYHIAWSSPNDKSLAFMSNVYTESLFFYGNSSSAAQVMDEKRKFAQRWPVRNYSIRDGTLTVSCAGHICDVAAIVDWFAHSPARAKSSNGVASFELQLDTRKLTITRETGSVHKGQRASPAGMLTKWHDENRRCRGGSGNDEKTWEACNAREHTGLSLQAAGLCYGRHGEYGAQMEWHLCGPGSLH